MALFIKWEISTEIDVVVLVSTVRNGLYEISVRPTQMKKMEGLHIIQN